MRRIPYGSIGLIFFTLRGCMPDLAFAQSRQRLSGNPSGVSVMAGRNPIDGALYAIAVDENGIVQTSGGGGSGSGVTPSISADATTLAAGLTVSVSRTGPDTNPVFHFGVPRGADGIPGSPGAPGSTPAVSADATTLAAGSSATVTRTGPDASPVFHFGIPRGADGSAGTGTGSSSSTGAKNGAYTSSPGTGGDVAPDLPATGSANFCMLGGFPGVQTASTASGTCPRIDSLVNSATVTITRNADGTASLTAAAGGGGGSQHAYMRMQNSTHSPINEGAGPLDKAVGDVLITENNGGNVGMTLDRAITITGVRYKGVYTPCDMGGTALTYQLADFFTGSKVVLAGTTATTTDAAGYGYDQQLPSNAKNGLSIALAAGHKLYLNVTGTVPSGKSCGAVVSAVIEYIGS